jgi:hypothetical protein
VVDSREATGGQGVEDHGRRAEEPFDLHDLLLSEHGLEPVEERNPLATERLVDQVDLEVNVVPSELRGGRTGPPSRERSMLRNTAANRLSTGSSGSVGHGLSGVNDPTGGPHLA